MKVEKRIELFIKREKFQPQAFEVCPKYEHCNVNKCPLHYHYKKLELMPDDKEQKCKLPKTIRKEIGIYFKLHNKGLTEREYGGYTRWENMSESEREVKKQKLRESSPFVRKSLIGVGK
jgi:hypothetical protein